MKRLLLYSALVFLLGCKKPDDSLGPLEGIYDGTFQRGGSVPCQVTITFEPQGRYTGTVNSVSSSGSLCPLISKGTFSTSGRVITFQDETTWPTTADKSLILTGEFGTEIRSGKLVLIKNDDLYILAFR
ncbi:hypothetical protein BN8_03243 [Fibrisoma limi BUZ 3]|uniref:Lipocalin-like domain-containing protein n=1 Tax=Fibrisoma limi BUZ 3 TaxID=1185876 RepID=I2GJM4_9BACT|nr:hypothetical protein [Fibrisoma limi]CCH54099.1 hypothetical protein BN8_03243 [Fibrisoma limi BUZ 3]